MKYSIKRLGLLAAAVTIAVGVGLAHLPIAQQADAQIGYYSRSGTGAVGLMVPVFNALTDTLIDDGRLLMADTTAASGTNLRRVVVKPWNCSQTADQRVVGISVGNIKRGRDGGAGTMLVWGYHPNVWCTSGMSFGDGIGPSFVTWGGVNTIADTLNIGRGNGWFLKYTSGTSTRGAVYLLRLGTVRL